MIERRKLVLALALTPGIGGKTITRTLVRCELTNISADEFFKLSFETLREEFKIAATAARNWDSEKRTFLKQAEELLKKLDAFGVQVVTAADDHYPFHIEYMDPDPPGMLFLYGNARLMNTQTFSVLSSRKAPPKALEAIEWFAEDGVLAGETLVSGHDTPEYQRSAVVPLRWGAPRILVLDTGFFNALGSDLSQEPFHSARLWRYKFDVKTDLAISAVNPMRDYHPNSNKVRDRLIGGLANRIDIAHLSPGGNMEKMVHTALKSGRIVRVHETVPLANALSEQGARIVYQS